MTMFSGTCLISGLVRNPGHISGLLVYVQPDIKSVFTLDMSALDNCLPGFFNKGQQTMALV